MPTTAATAKPTNTGKARDCGAVAVPVPVPVPADDSGTNGVTVTVGTTGTTGADGADGADGGLFARDFNASSGGSRGGITIVAA